MGYSHKIIYGIGINDLEYSVNIGGRGHQERCPFYLKWKDLIRRCYYDNFKELKKSYLEATTCESWIRASIFKSWMEKQDWEGNHLDKDLLVPGNKIYSPETCVFIPGFLNQAIKPPCTDPHALPVGVKERVSKAGVKTYYTAKIHTGNFIYKSKTFDNIEEAHLNWQNTKLMYFYYNREKYIATNRADLKVLNALDRIIQVLKDDIFYRRITTSW